MGPNPTLSTRCLKASWTFLRSFFCREKGFSWRLQDLRRRRRQRRRLFRDLTLHRRQSADCRTSALPDSRRSRAHSKGLPTLHKPARMRRQTHARRANGSWERPSERHRKRRREKSRARRESSHRNRLPPRPKRAAQRVRRPPPRRQICRRRHRRCRRSRARRRVCQSRPPTSRRRASA